MLSNARTSKTDRINLIRDVKSFQASPEFDGYTKVTLEMEDGTEISAGSDSGREFRIFCPWGNQQTAENILKDVQGYQYQPFTASEAILDPATELMDGVTINHLYSGVYERKIDFSSLITADIEAPQDEETNHEYPFKPERERRVQRQVSQLTADLRIQAGLIEAEVTARETDVKELRSSLSIQAGRIEAKVEKTDGSESFGWDMQTDHLTIHADGRDIVWADKYGLVILGTIEAVAGHIGGFDILPNYLSYNSQEWGGTNSTGAYLGIHGLQLGSAEGGCQIDMSGVIHAERGYFRGETDAGKIQYGSSGGRSHGSLSGSALKTHSVSGGHGGKLSLGSISTSNTTSGINLSLGYANHAHDVFNNITEADWMNARTSSIRTLYVGNLFVGGASYGMRTKTFTDGSGKKITLVYLGQ